MSETYPPEGDRPVDEQLPPGAYPQPPVPPGAEGLYSEPAGPPPGKQKLNWGFFALGFITPIVAGFVLGGLASLLASLSETAATGSLVILSGLQLLMLPAMVVLWLVGRSKGNNRLRSFGIGGLIYYAVSMLILLLAFGACFLTLGGN